VSVARAGSQCPGGGATPSLTVVSSEEGWRRVFPAPLGGQDAPPGVDFARELVVVVGMGQRPTGGHAVELLDGKAIVEGGVAAFRVAFRSPAAGSVVTQMITSPCLAVRLPREGVREVKVAGEDGKVVAAATVP
jgi:hypothetical protein